MTAKSHGLSSSRLSVDSRMGQPGAVRSRAVSSHYERASGGTETSKYPEERKSIETPGVAVSETGRA